jgi:hypothetical protein
MDDQTQHSKLSSVQTFIIRIHQQKLRGSALMQAIDAYMRARGWDSADPLQGLRDVCGQITHNGMRRDHRSARTLKDAKDRQRLTDLRAAAAAERRTVWWQIWKPA